MTEQFGGSVLHGRVVFLVGARRSGTNWLQRIIATHPSVAATPSETHLLSFGLVPMLERLHHGPQGSMTTATLHMEPAELHAACREFCDRVLAPHLVRTVGAELLVERTPWHVHHLDVIADVYPDARVLHIIRDGRDVARSLAAQSSWTMRPADIGEAAEEWRDAIAGAVRYRDRLERYHEVRYEDLFAEPRRVVGDVFAFLGLEVDDRVLDAALAEGTGRFNVDPSSPRIGPEKWRDGLSSEAVDTVLAVAGDTLVDLGYLERRELDAARRRLPVTPSRPTGRALLRRARRRAVAGAARGVAAVTGRLAPDPGDDAAPVTAGHMERSSALVDRFLSAVHRGRLDDIVELCRDDVHVWVVDDGEWRDRGHEALARLLRSTEAAGLSAGRQTRGDVHPGASTFAIMLAYLMPDGTRTEVAFVLHLSDPLIGRVVFYRYPTLVGSG